jgi:hypothetical protein
MLQETINITDEVEKAVPAGADEKAATAARSVAINNAVKAHNQRTGLECQSVSLYQGGEYWVYAYKTFTDVRLVACPEYQVAAFGKDDDNFTWPRHDLDFALLRVYENDAPYKPQHFLKWSTEGTKNGSLTFVSGHPGTTKRQYTIAQMNNERADYYPQILSRLETMANALRQAVRSSPDAERQHSARLMGIENSLKALTGYHKGLLDKEQMAKVQANEDELRAKVMADPNLRALAGDSWDKIEKAIKDQAAFTAETYQINLAASPSLFLAMNYIRSLKEAQRPEKDRLGGYQTESELAAIKEAFLKGPEGDPKAEIGPFTNFLAAAQTGLGGDHPFIQIILGGKTPEEAVGQALNNAKLANKPLRQSLAKGGLKALAASKDPLVAWAYKIEPYMTNVRRQSGEFGAIISDSAARIAKARF